MAATQGHTQSLHTNALDEALALPTDFSARIARNTQLLLQQESGTVPGHRPLGRQLLRRAAHLRPAPGAPGPHIEEVEAAGGMAKAIEEGIPKLRIEEAAARTQARIDSGRQPVIGVNKYRFAGDETTSTCSRSTTRRCAPSRSRSCARLRAERDAAACQAGARRADRRRGPAAAATARGQPARAGRRRRPRQGDRRRDLRCAREGVRPLHRAHPHDQSGVYRQEAGETGGHRARSARAAEDVRAGRGPPPADPGRQDGPGRPRPRAEGDRHARSPTSASTSTSARCSRPRPRWPARPSRPTCTSSESARSRPGT